MSARNLRVTLLTVAILAAAIAIFIAVKRRFRGSSAPATDTPTVVDRGDPGGPAGGLPTRVGPGATTTAGPRPGLGASADVAPVAVGPSGVDPGPTVGSAGTPGRPSVIDPDPDGSEPRPPPRVYVMDDGHVVRDHRRGGGAPPLATAPLPPEQRTMSSEVTARVYQQLSPIVAICGAQVPTTARGADPFVYINLTVRVAGGTLTTVDSMPVAHDIADAATAPLVKCIRDGLLPLRVAAAGEPDRAAYPLQYPIRIR